MIDAFLSYAQHDRGRSPNTIARYRVTLTTLAQTCDPATATLADVQAWWDSRLGFAPGTRANELACLRSFYKWSTRFGHRDDDPTRRLDFPKVPVRQPRPAGREDLAKLPGEWTEDAPDLRRAVALGAYAGLRVSEAAALDWSSIDPEERVAYVVGKGAKERRVPISSVLWDYLLPELTDGNVVRAGGRPILGDTLQRKLNRLMKRHGMAHTTHDLRKRGATLALERTGDQIAVCEMFGWDSLQTAKHYYRPSDDVLRKIAEAMI